MATGESVQGENGVRESGDSTDSSWSALSDMCRTNGLNLTCLCSEKSGKTKDLQASKIASVFKQLNGVAHKLSIANPSAISLETVTRTRSRREKTIADSTSREIRRVSPRRKEQRAEKFRAETGCEDSRMTQGSTAVNSNNNTHFGGERVPSKMHNTEKDGSSLGLCSGEPEPKPNPTPKGSAIASSPVKVLQTRQRHSERRCHRNNNLSNGSPGAEACNGGNRSRNKEANKSCARHIVCNNDSTNHHCRHNQCLRLANGSSLILRSKLKTRGHGTNGYLRSSNGCPRCRLGLLRSQKEVNAVIMPVNKQPSNHMSLRAHKLRSRAQSPKTCSKLPSPGSCVVGSRGEGIKTTTAHSVFNLASTRSHSGVVSEHTLTAECCAAKPQCAREHGDANGGKGAVVGPEVTQGKAMKDEAYEDAVSWTEVSEDSQASHWCGPDADLKLLSSKDSHFKSVSSTSSSSSSSATGVGVTMSASASTTSIDTLATDASGGGGLVGGGSTFGAVATGGSLSVGGTSGGGGGGGDAGVDSRTTCKWSKCDAQAETSALVDHIQTNHVDSQEGETYVCLWDGCKVYNKQSCSLTWLSRHVLSHSGDKPFRCIVAGCGQRFASQFMLERHVNAHFNSSNQGSQNKVNKVRDDTPSKHGKRRKFKGRKRAVPVKADDFLDTRTVERIRQRLVNLTRNTRMDVESPGNNVTFLSSVIARRRDLSGHLQVLLRWTPENILSDSWVPESQVASLQRRVIPVSCLPRDTVLNLDPSLYSPLRHRKHRRK